MARRNKQHDEQFKLDAVRYVKEHPDLTQEDCCKNLGIALSTLQRWLTLYRDSDGSVPTRGSGNYASDEQKEIARLKKELRDTQVDMFTTVFIGNSQTKEIGGKMVTPRGYKNV